MDIHNNRIRENLELFSFPRLSGTEFEKTAFNLAKQKVEGLGLSPKVQTFKFSTFYSRVYPKIIFPLVFWIILTLYLNINLPFLLTSMFLSFILYFPFFLLTRKPEKIRLGMVLESQNLYTKLNAHSNSQQEKTYDLIFMAHLDSKGQRITAQTRGLSIFLFTISILAITIILILRGFILPLYDFFTIFGVFPLLLLFIAVFILSTNTTNNRSKGVIDDASGIACVLEILHAFLAKEGTQMNYNLWFVLTGAEESGTMGVRNFYKYIQNLDRKKTYVINFDSIANHALLYNHELINKNNFKSYQYILENKEFFSLIGVKKVYIGTYSDGIFLQNRKFNGLGIGDYSSYRYVHSAEDNINNMNISVLKKLCQFLTILLRDID